MEKFINLKALDITQKEQYNKAVSNAFPKIISESQVIKRNWSKLENYFPEYQQFLISKDNELIGFINALPFQFDSSLNELSDSGWDWMFSKGISDFENMIKPNYLGGLQVIVRSKFQSRGYSKRILNHAKDLFREYKLLNLVIPIRPTEKEKFPRMPMSTYLNLKTDGKVFDPWIRTHITGGAEIIKVCRESMTMTGDISFWESILNRKIIESGKYELDGALELISIDVANNIGHYVEPNIWIKYN